MAARHEKGVEVIPGCWISRWSQQTHCLLYGFARHQVAVDNHGCVTATVIRHEHEIATNCGVVLQLG